MGEGDHGGGQRDAGYGKQTIQCKAFPAHRLIWHGKMQGGLHLIELQHLLILLILWDQAQTNGGKYRLGTALDA